MSSTQSQIQHGSHRRSSVAKAGEHKKLGRLRSLGLSELWQVGLLLPQHWEDFTHPIDDFAYPFLKPKPREVRVGSKGFGIGVSRPAKSPRNRNVPSN